jgi:hypothetical protein
MAAAADRATGEDAEAVAISFVVRIWKQPGMGGERITGWLEEVESGERVAFLGLEQLQATIAARAGVPPGRISRWRDGMRHPLACIRFHLAERRGRVGKRTARQRSNGG